MFCLLKMKETETYRLSLYSVKVGISILFFSFFVEEVSFVQVKSSSIVFTSSKVVTRIHFADEFVVTNLAVQVRFRTEQLRH